jgi:hypothetical protein
MCSCPNFILTQFAKGGHCKHINLIQDQYGRYGAAVTPSKAIRVGGYASVAVSLNSIWAGIGEVTAINHGITALKMVTGRMTGEVGAFDSDRLRASAGPSDVPVVS